MWQREPPRRRRLKLQHVWVGMVKNTAPGTSGTSRRSPAREGDNMIKIEVTTALKDALEHAVATGTPQVALYKDKPVVILSYEEYERQYESDDESGA
jgi:hypothetical protein